jgi:hypothetical protein
MSPFVILKWGVFAVPTKKGLERDETSIEARASHKGLPGLQSSVLVAQEVGARLGARKVL